MKAWVVRAERYGSPLQAMKLETVPVPTPGIGEVIVEVRAAGINYNHIWACKGQPVGVCSLHPEEPRHIGGSDLSGVIAALGEGVKGWKIGDEVITHPNHTCGQCVECNGLDPLACLEQKAWGFETTWGSYAEYSKVQSQQLLKKPDFLSWEEASCYGLKFFTAYRMLFGAAQIKPGDRVLIWGASGGLGSYAIQLCRAVNARPICVVSSREKEEFCRTLGAEHFIQIEEFPGFTSSEAVPTAIPNEEMRRFRKKLRILADGNDPDVVFEHVGRNTFSTSVFVAKRMGKIVTCGATTGYELTFDARYLWMHQKQILGSHGCNAYDAFRANELIFKKVIRPTLTRTYSFDEAAVAHEELLARHHRGSLAITVKAQS